MNAKASYQPAWLETLAARSMPSRDDGQRPSRPRFTDPQGRTILVARARWLLLALFGGYGLVAGVSFFKSDYGFFLTPLQSSILMVSVMTVIVYSLLFCYGYQRLSRFPYIDHSQVLLDLVAVSVLIHFSGGAASWFWPVYLIVTIEAAVLLERKREVLLMGALGGMIYGALLFGEMTGLIPYVSMPFVDKALYSNGLHIGLIWCWVSVLNATVALVSGFLMDVIRRENLRFQASEERMVDFLDSANDLIFCTNARGEILYVNQAWKQTLGFDGEALRGLKILDLVHKRERTQCLAAFKNALEGESGGVIEGQMINRCGDLVAVEGSITCREADEHGETIVWGICRNVSERQRAQEQLYHLAHHDTLTGLPNRLHFIDSLKQTIAMGKRTERAVAVLFLDLDRFKIINDTLGHAAGDALLMEVGERLKRCLRESDTVGRLGGDEFAIVLGALKKIDDCIQVAEKILKTLAEPVQIGEHELFITTSIGIARYPFDNRNPAELLKKADVAMYSAKGRGRNNYQLYEPEMDGDSDKRLLLENNIRRALENEELRLHYQPKVDVASGSINSMEALLRWQHPDLGLLPPSDFISLAEETGLIFAIGEWVLREACQTARMWQQKGAQGVRVAVNLSGYQLQQQGLVSVIQQILDETELAPELLELEVTETVVMQNPDFAVKILRSLRDLGIFVSIDDFGTGYSSLSHLKRFSVNTLKIDKAFVREVDRNSTDAAIATAIIAMGNSLDLKVIAEGVETEGQLEFLRQHHCDEIQGYLFSRPVPGDQALDLLLKGANLADKTGRKARIHLV